MVSFALAASLPWLVAGVALLTSAYAIALRVRLARVDAIQAFQRAAHEADADLIDPHDLTETLIAAWTTPALWLGPLAKLMMLLGFGATALLMGWYANGEHGLLGLSEARLREQTLRWIAISMGAGSLTSSLLLWMRSHHGRGIAEKKRALNAHLQQLAQASDRARTAPSTS